MRVGNDAGATVVRKLETWNGVKDISQGMGV